MTDEVDLNSREIHERTYPDGRVVVWRIGDHKNGAFQDIPLEFFKTLEDNGWIEVEFTDRRFVLSEAGRRELKARLLRDEIMAMRTRLQRAEAELKALQSEPTPD